MNACVQKRKPKLSLFSIQKNLFICSMLTCKNCATEFDGHYCPNCGQKYIDQRFTLKDSIFWAFHSIFNFDKGFFYTSIALIKRPGVVIKEFLDGITVRYAHPFRFIFIWATISAIVGVYAGTFEDTGIAMNEAMGMDAEALESTRKYNQFMKQYMSFIIMGMIPLFSLSTFWLFKAKKMNYAEHLIVNSFGQSSAILLGLPLTFSYLFYHDAQVIGTVNFIFGILIISRIYKQTFEVSWIQAIVKYLIGFLITIILFAVILVGALILYSILAKMVGWENPFIPQAPVPSSDTLSRLQENWLGLYHA